MTGGRGSRRPQRSIPRYLTAIAAVGAVAAVGAWMLASRSDGDGGSASVIAADPGVSHVHGLGLNPGDGSLVVATHFGSFRLTADGAAATRIGDSFQDTMGFTVVGPDHFLGSGHPDAAGMQAGQPGRLGLIESTDAGQSWTILSLGGDADFHALASAGGRVYGWDASSGRLMVSEDRTEWETRAAIDLFAFAVDPADVEHLVAATPQGLQESSDGGRVWRPADGPGLVTVSWADGSGLWGAEPDGDVWRWDREAWTAVGRLPGTPQAFLATDAALYAAVHDEGGVTQIAQSTDDGATWDIRYRDGD
jgi:hypothetical protein